MYEHELNICTSYCIYLTQTVHTPGHTDHLDENGQSWNDCTTQHSIHLETRLTWTRVVRVEM